MCTVVGLAGHLRMRRRLSFTGCWIRLHTSTLLAARSLPRLDCLTGSLPGSLTQLDDDDELTLIPHPATPIWSTAPPWVSATPAAAHCVGCHCTS